MCRLLMILCALPWLLVADEHWVKFTGGPYEVLSDAENRKKYDQYGKDWQQAEAFEKAQQEAGQRQNSRHAYTNRAFDEATGLLAASEQQLAQMVRQLVEDSSFRDRLARGAVAHAAEFHSMRNAQQLEQIIHRAAVYK